MPKEKGKTMRNLAEGPEKKNLAGKGPNAGDSKGEDKKDEEKSDGLVGQGAEFWKIGKEIGENLKQLMAELKKILFGEDAKAGSSAGKSNFQEVQPQRPAAPAAPFAQTQDSQRAINARVASGQQADADAAAAATASGTAAARDTSDSDRAAADATSAAREATGEPSAALGQGPDTAVEARLGDTLTQGSAEIMDRTAEQSSSTLGAAEPPAPDVAREDTPGLQ